MEAAVEVGETRIQKANRTFLILTLQKRVLNREMLNFTWQESTFGLYFYGIPNMICVTI